MKTHLYSDAQDRPQLILHKLTFFQVENVGPSHLCKNKKAKVRADNWMACLQCPNTPNGLMKHGDDEGVRLATLA